MQVNLLTEQERRKYQQLRLFPDLLEQYRGELLKAEWDQAERERRFLDRLEQVRRQAAERRSAKSKIP